MWLFRFVVNDLYNDHRHYKFNSRSLVWRSFFAYAKIKTVHLPDIAIMKANSNTDMVD